MSGVFFDSNILVYAFSSDKRRLVARGLLDAGGIISVQCLNEFVNVARGKFKMRWMDIADATAIIRECCPAIRAVDIVLHDDGLRLAERFMLSIYDGMIVAAALAADCDVLYSEDMHHGLVVDGRLRIVNPFTPA